MKKKNSILIKMGQIILVWYNAPEKNPTLTIGMIMELCLFFLLIIALFCLPLAQATAESDLPQEISLFFSSQGENEYAIDASIEIEGYYFVTAKDMKGINHLFGFKQDPGSWNYWLHTIDAVPQGTTSLVLGNAQGSSDLVTEKVNTDPTLSINRISKFGDSCDMGVNYVLTNGTWLLCKLYSTEANNQYVVYCYNNTVTYYADNNATKPTGTVKGTIQRDLCYANISNIPKSYNTAREKLTVAPAVPEGSLQATEIKFTGGKKYAVYSAPDENSMRSGNGKAAVSTNDWIQVFGREDDWILIQYAIDKDHYRFGYIPVNALPKKASVNQLEFLYTGAATATTVTVTDDPLFSQSSLVTLQAGSTVTWLATMGDWAYVEYEGKEKVRGFVPVNSLTTEIIVDGMKITNATAATNYLKGRAWFFEAGGNMTYECLQFRPEGPDEGTVQAYSLDYDKDPSFDHLIADPLNTDWYKDGKTGTWAVENCDGTEGFWNDPELKLLLTFDGITKDYGLTIEYHYSYQPVISEKTFEGVYTFSLTDHEGSGSWMECPDITVTNENGTNG